MSHQNMTEYFAVSYAGQVFDVAHSNTHHGESWRIYTERGNVISAAKKVASIRALCNDSTRKGPVVWTDRPFTLA